MMEEKSKSSLRRSPGRPRKHRDDKLSYTLKTRLTEKEGEQLENAANEMKIPVSEYVRMAIFNTEITRPFTEQELKLKIGLVGMANNLNQLAYQANAAGFETVQDSARALLSEIKKELEKFRK